MTKPKTLDQLRAEKERAETQLARIEDDLRNLFTQVPYRNLQEVINEQKQRDSGVL